MSKFAAELSGQHTIQRAFAAEASGLHRVADDDVEGFELYRGIGSEPDPDTDAPFETFASLPHTTAALAAATTYFFILVLRNKHNQRSENIDSFKLELDGSGNEVNRPSEAKEIAIEPSAAGGVRILASYFYRPDGANAADTFLVYLRTDGTDPDPLLDVPVEVTMRKADGRAKLNHVIGPHADDLDARVIVRTRREGPPDVDSESTTVFTTTTNVDGPATPEGGIFFGTIAEQRQ